LELHRIYVCALIFITALVSVIVINPLTQVNSTATITTLTYEGWLVQTLFWTHQNFYSLNTITAHNVSKRLC